MRKKQLKLILSFVFIMSLLFLAVGCGDDTTSDADEATGETEDMFEAGTYTGVGEGYNGDIEVEVEVDSESIQSIEVLEHNETEGLTDDVFDNIPDEVVNDQTIDVDTVSGATSSSEGLIAAITEALEEAGGDIDRLRNGRAEQETATEDVEYETDVVVVGAGGAGLASAVSAYENGAEVMVLEKMPQVGGNTLISGSAYNAVDPERQEQQGIEDSVDKHFEQTYEGGDEEGDPELVRELVENAYPTLQWLEELGMEFEDEVFTVLGGLWPRAHKPVEPLGTGYINTYMNYIEGTNDEVQVLVNTEVKEMIMDGDKVVGVEAEGENGKVTVKAESVVLASGGFGADVDMRNEYNTEWPDLSDIPTTNHTGATGEGIEMVKDVGANLIGMDDIQLLPMGDPETGSLSGNIEQGVENRIFVNKEGNRFVDEGARRDVMTNALFEQPDSFMWIIVDETSYPTGDTVNNFNESIDDLVEAGRAYKADTLEGLAEKIDVDPDNFVQAVEEFNEGVEEGEDELGRTLFDQKLDSPPYYAGGRVPTVHHTMGGVEINVDAQVINEEGEVIKGLYAAGEVTGGIHGSNRLGGNALADVNTFGRIAGESAAKQK